MWIQVNFFPAKTDLERYFEKGIYLCVYRQVVLFYFGKILLSFFLDYAPKKLQYYANTVNSSALRKGCNIFSIPKEGLSFPYFIDA